MSHQKKRYLPFVIIILISICAQTAMSQKYYADIQIEITERGDAIITGTTNHPTLIGTHSDMTSKQEQYWLFNLTKENFSQAIFRINFPEGAIITYIRSTAQINIGAEGETTFVRGILRDKPLEIIIQYYYEETPETKRNYAQIIISITLILLGIYITFFYKTKKEKQGLYQEKQLTKRQKKIVELLEKKDGVTQKYLEEQLKIPKASISRNVATLERKGIIKKTTRGFSNILYLIKEKNK